MPSVRVTCTSAAPKVPESVEELAWLAGLLEGEGSFGVYASMLTVTLVMTDKDVVVRVADIFGTAVAPLSSTALSHKTAYATRVRGSRAALFLELILPMMGNRRRETISEALALYKESVVEPANRRRAVVQERNATLLRSWETARAQGQSFRSFCSERNLCRRATEKKIQAVERRPSIDRRSSVVALSNAATTPSYGLLPTSAKTAWLAGLLEGEGHFRVSAAGGLAITLKMTDLDVVERVATEFRAYVRLEVPRKAHWKDAWLCRSSAQQGRALGALILPWMGQRRASKINQALCVDPAVAKLGVHEAKAAEALSAWLARTPGEGLRPVARRLGMAHETLRKIIGKNAG